ncbi:MAG: TRAP transporter small permease [Alphaproteobacteria bacterium]
MTRMLLRDFYEKFEQYCCAFLISAMVFCLGTQVFFRFVLNASLTWPEELSRFVFIWAVYMGAILGAKERIHIRVTATQLLLPVQYRRYMTIFADLVWVVVNLFFAYQGAIQVGHLLRFTYISPALQWNMAYVFGIVPFGFLLMSFRILEGYWRDYRRGGLQALGHDLVLAQRSGEPGEPRP